MIWSPTRDALVASLAAAQGKFADPAKGRTGKILSKKGEESSYSYSYSNLADFLPDVREVLSAEGVALVQAVAFEGDGEHRHLALVTELVKGEQWVRSTIPLAVHDGTTTQQFGSEITYARRYALMALLGLAAVDDDDDGKAATDAKPEPRKRAEPAPKREAAPPKPRDTLAPEEVEVFRRWRAEYHNKTFTPMAELNVELQDQTHQWLATSEGKREILKWRNNNGGTP